MPELVVNEIFHSIQGESSHMGRPCSFIRLTYCNLRCTYCDTAYAFEDGERMSVDEIIHKVDAFRCGLVEVTGGEPLLYNLDYLCKGLHDKGIATFLETSGSLELSGEWDWICLSPKRGAMPLTDIFSKANELKVIIEKVDDLEWAEKNAIQVSSECILYLQPEWSKRNFIIPVIVKYIQEHPKWKISLQAHKYMRIP